MQLALCNTRNDFDEPDGDTLPINLFHLYYFAQHPCPGFVTAPGVQHRKWGDERETRHSLDLLDKLLTSRYMGLLE